MAKEIYNLGRSVGMSAWEVYVRQSLLLNPDIEPLSEREWLSESVGVGTSMLLRIKAHDDSGVHYVDYELPPKSLLCAPNTIIGSFFFGEAVTADEEDESLIWCSKITDYGVGISNTRKLNPGDGSKEVQMIPTQAMSHVSDKIKKRLLQYVKIQDAIMLQDGVWSNSGTPVPAKTFIPDLTKPSTIRIIFQDTITTDFYLLLTGFSTRAIIKGEVGFDMGSVLPDDPADAGLYRTENGDFLGPRLYPWSSKVVFTYPPILTWLLRDNIQSMSNNLGIKLSSESLDTIISMSNIEAGPGVQVNDPSDPDNRAKKITISSRIATDNNYVKIVQQTSEQTNKKEGDTSRIPTHVQGSPASPAPGVGITQPTEPGAEHKIGAKMATSAGRGQNYLGISQTAANDADTVTTTLSPSYGHAEAGIGISDPASPGQPFRVSSKMGTKGDGSNYVKVEQIAGTNADQQTTTLTPSKSVPGQGVGITQPNSPGDPHVVSSKVKTEGCGKHYIGINQPSNENRTANDFSTIFNPAKITPGKGIAITQPVTPGNDIIISSLIVTSGKGSAPNYIKVEQEAHDTGCGCGCGDGKGADTRTTILSPSLLVQGKRTVIKQPTTPGGDIEIGINLNFIPGNGIGITDDLSTGNVTISSIVTVAGPGALGLRVSQSAEANSNTASTILYPSKIVVAPDSREFIEVNYPTSQGGDISISLKIDAIIARMLKSGALRGAFESIINKIYLGGTLNENGTVTWPNQYKVPLGDLNIYSNGGAENQFDNAIRSRDPATNDLRVV